MLEDLIQLEDSFQPYLLKGAYTFIGPSDFTTLQRFIKRVNDVAPANPFDRSIHSVLSNKAVVRKVLGTVSPNTELRIYVIPKTSEDVLVYATIEEYCDRNHITFPPQGDN